MASRPSSARWVLAVALLHVLVFAVFVRAHWVVSAIADERGALDEAVGPHEAASVERRADAWFARYLVDPGVVTESYALYIPDPAAPQPAGWERFSSSSLFSWFEARITTFWTLVYLALHRVSAALVWFPYIGFVVVPLLVDGFVARRVRQHAFESASPMKHGVARFLIGGALYSLVLLLLAPFALSPYYVPVSAMLVAAAARTAIANAQKAA